MNPDEKKVETINDDLFAAFEQANGKVLVGADQLLVGGSGEYRWEDTNPNGGVEDVTWD